MDLELTQLRGVALIRNLHNQHEKVYCWQSLDTPATNIFLANYDAVFVCDIARMACDPDNKQYVYVEKLGEPAKCGWVAWQNLMQIPRCTREVREITFC